VCIKPSGIDYKMHSCSSSMSDINIISVPPSIQTVIRVIRKPGTALGISIAGGRGSMPFIGNDDVRALEMHVYLTLPLDMFLRLVDVPIVAVVQRFDYYFDLNLLCNTCSDE
jgi:hypothetical protein